MMFCGAVPRNAGASGDAAVRFVLLTFHHRRVVPSGAVKIRFQSKGFSLVEFSCTGRAFGAAGAQGAKSWARMSRKSKKIEKKILCHFKACQC